VTVQAAHDDIVIDARSGRVKGARVGERVAIILLRASVQMLMPFHNFGFSYIARLTRSLFTSTRSMVFVLEPDSRMRVDYCDAYWSVLLAPNYPYEPSIRSLLADSSDVGYGFIDGGANHGFWSILVSSAQAGSNACVAIEAASDTYRHLRENRQINAERFQALNRAIGSTSGERVRIYGAKHEARSMVAPSEGAVAILDCETITVDDIAAMPEFDGLEKFIVKLDVEGMEIAAFSGASRLLERDTAFVYEDHGSDREHKVTRHAIDTLKLRVFWLGEGGAREVRSPDELGKIKKTRRFGYDMVATRSPFWIERLQRLVAASATRH
jgi:FkbM family methyltransferase